MKSQQNFSPNLSEFFSETENSAERDGSIIWMTVYGMTNGLMRKTRF